MWRRVELGNFRSIESVTVDLAPFTVVVGPNGSGKSSFADALLFARDVAFDAESAVNRRGGITSVRRWRSGAPAEVTVDVRLAASRAELETDYVRHRFVLGATGEGWRFDEERIELVEPDQPRWELSRSPEEPHGWLKGSRGGYVVRELMPSPTASAMVLARQTQQLRRAEALTDVRRIVLNPDSMRRPHLAGEVTRLDEPGTNIAAAYRSLSLPSQERVLLAMQRIIPGLEQLSVDRLDRYQLLKFAQRQAGGALASFSAAEMSEGALRALGILVAAEQITANELLIIEEPEVSIHPGAAQLLFEVLKSASERGAVLITTHSADFLDAACDEEILVCSYRDGVTRIGPLSTAQRSLVKEGLFSVAELMRSEPLRIEGEPPEAAEP